MRKLISSMSPYREFEVIKPFDVFVKLKEEEFIASFKEVNLSAYGATPEEAVYNLKDIIAITFESLEEKHQKLAFYLTEQLKTLKYFIKKTPNN
jgi:predicted RNase H-like HicB family nuclease